MNTQEENKAPVQQKSKPFVCPVDPAELEQCEACQ